MPNDLSIQAATPVNLGNDAVGPGKPAATVVPTDHAAPPPFPSLNPSLQLDAALGIVVLEFRNDAGTVTSSIPSEQQLAAYRQWQDVRTVAAPEPGAAATDIAPAAASSAPPKPAVTPAPALVAPHAPTPAPANGHTEDLKV